MMPTGTLMKKIHSHPKASTSTPPRMGPTSVAIPATGHVRPLVHGLDRRFCRTVALTMDQACEEDRLDAGGRLRPPCALSEADEAPEVDVLGSAAVAQACGDQPRHQRCEQMRRGEL